MITLLCPGRTYSPHQGLPYEPWSKFIVKRKCVIKFVSPLSFYRVWCFNDFSLGYDHWKIWISGIIQACPLDSFFVGSQSASEITVSEFTIYLAGEWIAMWHFKGVRRTPGIVIWRCIYLFRRPNKDGCHTYTWVWLMFHCVCGPFLSLAFQSWRFGKRR
jgi:hypothetical protein